MALVKCPECGNSVSEQANTCPQCGYPLKKENPAQEKNSIQFGELLNILSAVSMTAELIVALLFIFDYMKLGLYLTIFIPVAGLTLWLEKLKADYKKQNK